MRPRSGIVVLAAAILALAVPGRGARANALQTFQSVATDPLGIVRGTGNVRETALQVIAQLQPLLDRGDAIAQQRLEQIHQIIMSTTTGGMAMEDKAIAALEEMQITVMADIDKVFSKLDCERTTTSHDVIGTLDTGVNHLAAAHPTLRILGVPIASVTFRRLMETAPNTTFVATRDAVEAELERSVHDDTSAYVIMADYSNLEVLAKATRCFYQGQPDEITFLRQQDKYDVLQQQWNTAVTLQP